MFFDGVQIICYTCIYFSAARWWYEIDKTKACKVDVLWRFIKASIEIDYFTGYVFVFAFRQTGFAIYISSQGCFFLQQLLRKNFPIWPQPAMAIRLFFNMAFLFI